MPKAAIAKVGGPNGHDLLNGVCNKARQLVLPDIPGLTLTVAEPRDGNDGGRFTFSLADFPSQTLGRIEAQRPMTGFGLVKPYRLDWFKVTMSHWEIERRVTKRFKHWKFDPATRTAKKDDVMAGQIAMALRDNLERFLGHIGRMQDVEALNALEREIDARKSFAYTVVDRGGPHTPPHLNLHLEFTVGDAKACREIAALADKRGVLASLSSRLLQDRAAVKAETKSAKRPVALVVATVQSKNNPGPNDMKVVRTWTIPSSRKPKESRTGRSRPATTTPKSSASPAGKGGGTRSKKSPKGTRSKS